MKFWTLVVIACLLFALSCTHKAPYVITPDLNTELEDTTVCFERDVLPIFTGSCGVSNCHDATSKYEGYQLTDYAHIIAKGIVKGNATSSRIYRECANGSMPESPYAKLDSTKLSYLRRWINMGAPNDTNCRTKCDTTVYTYSGAVTPILNTYCISCHSATGYNTLGGGVNLGDYNAVKVVALNGRLYGSMNHSAGYSAMPKNMARLSDCKVAQIRRWIAAGAPNN